MNLILPLAQLALTTVLGLLGVRISRQSAQNNWLQTLGSINDKFWNDPDISLIRCCITYPNAYERLQKILEKRKRLYNQTTRTIQLSEEEYVLLDKLDKFLHLLQRAAISSPRFGREPDLWKALLFNFWLIKCMDHVELRWYITNFYDGLNQFYKKWGYLENRPGLFLKDKEAESIPFDNTSNSKSAPEA